MQPGDRVFSEYWGCLYARRVCYLRFHTGNRDRGSYERPF
ncbi:MAG: hypothetical protein RJA70_436 [Pseudomonadota bacterium]|jgi:hypothetical protein